MLVKDVIAAIESFAPAGLAYSWDRMGLATGAPDQPVKKVLATLTVTGDALKAAKRAKADMIVAHHPLIWDPLRSLRSDDAQARLCMAVASAGIACYSAHTNLDVAPGGVNDILFAKLGLTDRAPLFPVEHTSMVKLVAFVPELHLPPIRDAVSQAGAGIIGNYTHCGFSAPGTGTFRPSDEANPFVGGRGILNEEPERRFETLVPKEKLPAVLAALIEAHPYEEPAYDVYPLEAPRSDHSLGLIGALPEKTPLKAFARQVCKALEIDHVRFTGAPGTPVQTVALMGGAGGGSTPRVPAGVDVFVTGDVKYHEAVDAQERGLNIVDAGHHGTEKLIVPWFAKHLKATCKGLRVATYVEPDPFRTVGPK